MNGLLGQASGPSVQTGVMMTGSTAKFALGQGVRLRDGAFSGVVIDVDAVYDGAPDQPGPEHPDQPFYQVLTVEYGRRLIAYAGEDVLEADPAGDALAKDQIAVWFTEDGLGHRAPRAHAIQ